MNAPAPAFSASDAAFSGFRLIGKKPGAVAAWALVYLIYQAVLGALMVALMGDKLVQLQAMTETNRTDPEAALAMLPSLGLLFVILLPLALVFSSVMNTAVFRAFLRPADRPGFGYLRLGRDELRMGVLIVLWVALAIGYAFLAVFIYGLGMAAGGALPGAVRPLFYFLWSMALIPALIYPAVRLSLSGPMTVAQNHIRVFESWHLTKGRFWSLFGAYFLCGVMIFVVLIVGMIVVAIASGAVALATGSSLATLSTVFRPDYSSLAAFLSPPRLVAMLLNAPISAMGFAIASGPSVEAYQVLSGLDSPYAGAHAAAAAGVASEPVVEAAPPVDPLPAVLEASEDHAADAHAEPVESAPFADAEDHAPEPEVHAPSEDHDTPAAPEDDVEHPPEGEGGHHH